jgi:hypothetical protein
MSANTFKIKKNSSKGSFFSWVEKNLRIDGFEKGIPLQFMPQLLFLAFLLIFYIGNKHFAEKTIRNISNIETEVEDLRADYTTLKADYMFASKLSEVAKRAGKLNLVESKEPPFKIVVKE